MTEHNQSLIGKLQSEKIRQSQGNGDLAIKWHNEAIDMCSEIIRQHQAEKPQDADIIKTAIIDAFQKQGVVDGDREQLYDMSHEEIADIATKAAITAMENSNLLDSETRKDENPVNSTLKECKAAYQKYMDANFNTKNQYLNGVVWEAFNAGWEAANHGK